MNYKNYLSKKIDDSDENEDSFVETPYSFEVEQPEDSIIKVPEVPNYSAELGDAEDFIDSNSKVFDIYGKGEDPKMVDNSRTYEVIKIIKDVMDKHLYVNSVQYKTNNKSDSVVFRLTLTDSDEKTNEFFIDGLINFIKTSVYGRLGKNFEFDYELKKNVDGLDTMVLRITDTLDKEHSNVNILDRTF